MGKPAKTIDQVPLEWCYGDGIVIDMKHKADFDPITIEDLKGFLSQNNLRLIPDIIVLIKTGRDQYMGTKDFLKNDWDERRRYRMAHRSRDLSDGH